MATPYQPKLSDPRKVFGFGKQPLSDYFSVPKGAAFNPAFSPAAQEMLLEDEVMTRDRDVVQRQFEAEDAANALLDNAPNMRNKQIQREILRNPRILETPQYKTINEFLGARQEVRKPNPRSDRVLAPAFAAKIEDPALRSEFQGMIDSGMPFEEASGRIWTMQDNAKQAIQLAEAEVPEEEFETLKRPDGRLDPTAVARRIAQAKREQQAQRYGKDPVDQEIGWLTDAIRTQERVLKADMSAPNPAEDPLFIQLNQALAKAYGEKLNPPAPVVPTPTTGPIPLVPPGEGVVPPPAPGGVDTRDQPNPVSVAPPPGQQAFMDALTPEEAQEQFEKQNQQAVADTEQQAEIDAAWTNEKLKLGSDILKQYPNKDEPYGNPAVLAARAILAQKMATVKKKVGFAGNEIEDLVPYPVMVLQKIGRKPGDVAFKEPQNKRWGTQDVRNTELLEAWARDFLASKGLLQTGSEAETPVEELVIPAEDQALIDKYSAP